MPSEKRTSVLKRAASKKEMGVLSALILLCVFLAITSPYFLKITNIFNVLRQFSVFGILAVGQAFIIITAGIDLSVGSMIGFTACSAALLAARGAPWPVVILVTCLAGALAGGVNGFFVNVVKLNPFIATMGVGSVVRGTTLLLTDGMPVSFDSEIGWLGNGYIGPVPVQVIIMVLVMAIGYIISIKTQIGRNIYAVGNNARAAQLSGVNVGRVKYFAYISTGVLASICGMVLAGNLMNADPSLGQGYEMDIIAAVVIGGVSLSGGEGSTLGVFLGAALMGVLRNGFTLLSISAYWQIVTIGIVILLAVSTDSIRKLGRKA